MSPPRKRPRRAPRALEKDIEEGSRAGVTGTPACFINGRLVSGAQPLERFTRVIEEELARAR